LFSVAPRYTGDTTVTNGTTLKYLLDAATPGTGTTRVDGNATITIAREANVHVGDASALSADLLDPFSDQLDPARHTAVENNGTLEIDAGSVALRWLAMSAGSATGDTIVHDGAMLTVAYAVQNSATIGDGDLLLPPSGIGLSARQSSPGTQPGLTPGVTGVPEPGAWLLLAAGSASLLPLRRRYKR
jgi:hypothetical protein